MPKGRRGTIFLRHVSSMSHRITGVNHGIAIDGRVAILTIRRL
jgi:hypothetical protein